MQSGAWHFSRSRSILPNDASEARDRLFSRPVGLRQPRRGVPHPAGDQRRPQPEPECHFFRSDHADVSRRLWPLKHDDDDNRGLQDFGAVRAETHEQHRPGPAALEDADFRYQMRSPLERALHRGHN